MRRLLVVLALGACLSAIASGWAVAGYLWAGRDDSARPINTSEGRARLWAQFIANAQGTGHVTDVRPAADGLWVVHIASKDGGSCYLMDVSVTDIDSGAVPVRCDS